MRGWSGKPRRTTLAGLPDVSVISASHGYFLDLLGQESLEQGWDSSSIQPALAGRR
jgi:hypothetical protein